MKKSAKKMDKDSAEMAKMEKIIGKGKKPAAAVLIIGKPKGKGKGKGC